MDAGVRLSSRGQLSDHPGRRCVMKARGWTTALLLRHEIGATATADRAIILVSMLNERKDDDQETQTSFVTV